jgi:hypothetical protein
MRTSLRNTVVVIGALVPLAVIDYFYVRSGQDNDSIWWSPWVNWPALLVAPAGFFWANWPALSKAHWAARFPLSGRVALNVALAAVVAVVWFYVVAFTVIGNLHIALGGRL